MQFPDNFRYTTDHEWLRLEADGHAYVGITDFAQSELGELVYVDIPTVGSELNAGDIFGTVEAVKTTSDLLLPVGGVIVEVNPELDAHPEYINQSPYDQGWIIKMRVSDPSEAEALMDASAYSALVS